MRHRGHRHLSALWRRRLSSPRRRLVRSLPRRTRLRVAASLAAAGVLAAGTFVVADELGSPEHLGADPPAPHRGAGSDASRHGSRAPLTSLTATPTVSQGTRDTPEQARRPSRAQSDRSGGPSSHRARAGGAARPGLRTPTESLPTRAPAGAVETGTPDLPEAPRTRPSDPTRTTSRSPSPTPTDDTPPETSFDSGPRTHDDGPFVFGADEPATFACSLDGGRFRPCSSPEHVDVGPGRHTFAVRATDRAGNVEDSPATWSWLATGLGDPLEDQPRLPGSSGVDSPR